MHKSLAFFGAAARRTHGRDLENKTALPDLIFIMVFGKRRKISSVCLFSQSWKTFRLTGVCLHLNPDGWYDFQIRLGKSTPIPYSWEGKHGKKISRSSSVSYLFFHWRVCKKKPHIYNSCSALLAKKAHKVYVGFFISRAPPFSSSTRPWYSRGGQLGLI